MKTSLFFGAMARLCLLLGLWFFCAGLGSCSGKSNSEDDTFRQSIIDDPQKAVDQNEAAKLNQRKQPADSLGRDTLDR